MTCMINIQIWLMIVDISTFCACKQVNRQQIKVMLPMLPIMNVIKCFPNVWLHERTDMKNDTMYKWEEIFYESIEQLWTVVTIIALHIIKDM